ncbi:MlaD family protein [Bdellovibrio reynosensis]|uniref:MlaD family protein n=1 Tax=Bdellovibrio reynosensis TaxID=2835041 RepID=A0ABY4C7G6_9BACT|nr:MlaD family protein [Bdellovibrio reynosensis]UOF00654.1 MlaD family protein [Bdellovibrio reynosensis]
MGKKLESLKTGWYLWLFPIFALLISAYLFYGWVQESGTEIKITFDDGSGIEPEKTEIRYRGIEIGSVKKVELADDNKSVKVHATLIRDIKGIAVKGSKFWIVRPQVTLQGISGLETIIGGTYISVQPGKDDAPEELDFKGREGSSSKDPTEDTATYYLETPFVSSISVDDPVTFRGMKIGSVTNVNISKTAQKVIVQINLAYKFMRLIRTNTLFWEKMAVQAKLGLLKSEIKISSFETALRGGIELSTPDNPGPMAKSHTHFPLHGKPPKDFEKWNPVLESK